MDVRPSMHQNPSATARAHTGEEAARARRFRKRKRDLFAQSVIDGVVLFVLVEFVFGAGRYLTIVLAGLGVGLAWGLLRAGRSSSPLIAVPVWIVLHGSLIWSGSVVLGAGALAALAAARGVVRDSSDVFSG